MPGVRSVWMLDTHRGGVCCGAGLSGCLGVRQRMYLLVGGSQDARGEQEEKAVGCMNSERPWVPSRSSHWTAAHRLSFFLVSRAQRENSHFLLGCHGSEFFIDCVLT